MSSLIVCCCCQLVFLLYTFLSLQIVRSDDRFVFNIGAVLSSGPNIALFLQVSLEKFYSYCSFVIWKQSIYIGVHQMRKNMYIYVSIILR